MQSPITEAEMILLLIRFVIKMLVPHMDSLRDAKKWDGILAKKNSCSSGLLVRQYEAAGSAKKLKVPMKLPG